MQNSTPRIFLGANSADGFINKFYNKNEGLYTYIIKGGPGSGKSSFMKAVAKKSKELGKEVIVSPCSSDPDSLDAVVLPREKIMIADGTAPHVLEPVYPGVCEEIINFADFWDKKVLQENKEKIIDLTDKNKTLHKKASVCLNALGRVKRDNMNIYLGAVDIQKTAHFAAQTANRHLKKGGEKAEEKVCFLSGETPVGSVFFEDTVNYYCSKKVIISDTGFAVGSIIMSVIRDIALGKGYRIIVAKNHLLTNDKIDHIIVPEADVAFCCESDSIKFSDEGRRIRADRFVDKEVLKKNSNRIALNKKLEAAFLTQAHKILSEAKAVHDDLEANYIKAMDYTVLNKFREDFIKKLFS